MAARKPLVIIGGAQQELPGADSINVALSWLSTSGASAGYVIKYSGGVVTWAAESGGGGGISDAPVDGTPYSREDAGWVPAIPEAPSDGKPYARKNADWEEIEVAATIPLAIPIAVSDETTALTAGVTKVAFRMPFAMVLTAVRASLTTAQGSGSIFTVDINEGGTSILSTKLTIDNTETTSTTAATPAVISDIALANDAEITIDIDQIGASGATGLKVYLIGTEPVPVSSVCIPIGCSDEVTALSSGTNKVVFRMPYAMTLTGVRASLTTAQTSGSTFTVDINENGTSILSNKITIDNTEKTSTTAAVVAIISDASLANDAEISIDIDQVGDGTAKGLKVYLLGDAGMIRRDTDIRAALRSRAAPQARQRGFLLNPYRFAAGGSGDPNWGNVSALLHMDGTPGASTFTDETGKTWTTTGTAIITNTTAQFGQSAVFDGTGGAITGPSSADFTFGTGDFTIECWAHFTSIAANRAAFSFGSNLVVYLATNGTMYYFDGSSNFLTGPTITLGAWDHYALVRNAGALGLYIGGTNVANGTYTTNITSTNMLIGNNPPANTPMQGYIDEFRVTEGVARYTSNFTPPSSPFPNSL